MAERKEGKKPDRKEWFSQMRAYKHDFLVKELKLSQQQQDKFFPLYDAMTEGIMAKQRCERDCERRINRCKGQVSDAEYEKAVNCCIDTHAYEARMTREYYEKFKSILTAEQLYKLTQAERKFTREVMKQHSRMAGRHAKDGDRD